MDRRETPDSPPAADFHLADWLVQPSLNRVSGGDRMVQIEPKMMDVLVFLADRAGDVVSKRDISDSVWPDVFTTEAVITRAIAGLRRAFGDDAQNPRFIETISKRGYRLIAKVSSPPETASRPRSARSIEHPVSIQPRVPFVVGQWVRGETFYGRTAEIAEILEGNRNWLWLMGTRRIGKTSLLKQLEHIALTTPELGFFPVFWDLQGADSSSELHLDFGEALNDVEERLFGLGIEPSDVRTDDLFDSMGRLRRELNARNVVLLLLCDEVEELIHLNAQDPALLRKLRRAMQSREGIRSVLASSPRLWQLADTGADTSPFLDGFTPPIVLGCLDDEEARDLVMQTGLPTDSRPEFADDIVERIRDTCGNHPYVIQMLCRRALEHDDLGDAIDGIAADPSLDFFFDVDYQLLDDSGRRILRALAERQSASPDSLRETLPDLGASVMSTLRVLQGFGLVRRHRDGGLQVANEFFRRWLAAKG